MEITRHLTLMNSRRGNPVLFLLVFTSPIEKKAIDREHHSSKGVHFEFHVSKVHLYICRVIFIFLLPYSNLYCKKEITHILRLKQL